MNVLEQIDPSSWVKIYDLEWLCQTKFSVQDMEYLFNIPFEEYEEEGLGTCYAAFVEIEGHKYFLQGHEAKNSRDPGVLVHMQGNNPSVPKSLASVMQAFNISESELAWVQDAFSVPTWILTRQGDDGNKIEMTRFYRREVAEFAMQEYEKRGHKQYYEVTEDSTK